METLLVHNQVAAEFLPEFAGAYASFGVEPRGCPQTQALLPGIKAASEEDWHTEYLAPILSIKVVPSLEAAIEHINSYSSQHRQHSDRELQPCAPVPHRSGFKLGDDQRLHALCRRL